MSHAFLADEENTYIFDPESATEIARLIDQGQMITKCMGGPLAEQAHPEHFHTILDLACGPGSWVLDAAFAYPDSLVIGTDLSKIMVHYAKTRTRRQRLNNASFAVMDIRQPFAFADE